MSQRFDIFRSPSSQLYTIVLHDQQKLENIGDSIYRLAEYVNKRPISVGNKGRLIESVQHELRRSVERLAKHSDQPFKKIKYTDIEELENLLADIKDDLMTEHLSEIVRYIVDVEEETVTVAFYNKLSR